MKIKWFEGKDQISNYSWLYFVMSALVSSENPEGKIKKYKCHDCAYS